DPPPVRVGRIDAKAGDQVAPGRFILLPLERDLSAVEENVWMTRTKLGRPLDIAIRLLELTELLEDARALEKELPVLSEVTGTLNRLDCQPGLLVPAQDPCLIKIDIARKQPQAPVLCDRGRRGCREHSLIGSSPTRHQRRLQGHAYLEAFGTTVQGSRSYRFH